MSNPPILEARNLGKTYENLTAVDSVNFIVQQGECLGILGPNGAGKTTTIEMIETIITPSDGEIYFKGQPVSKNKQNFKEKIGIQFQSTALQEHLKVKDHLKFFKSLYPRNSDIDFLIDKCQLKDLLNQDANKLSGGQRQRLLLAIALLNDPEIVFLDEPTTGLDPSSRQDFWRLIKNIKAQGKTIVLTTHYMDEAYNLCDRLIIMQKGKIITEGSPKKLLADNFKETILQIPHDNATEQELTMLKSNLVSSDFYFEINTTNVNQTLQELIKRKVNLEGIKIRSATLDDLFLYLTKPVTNEN